MSHVSPGTLGLRSTVGAEARPLPLPDTTDGLPLCVDLDGTLILSDVLFESFLLLVRQAPLTLALVPVWLLRGKAVLKAEIAARVVFCVGTLPYDVRFIRWLEAERAAGRRLWLCTAANETLAAGIAEHLQLFDGVLASDRSVNISGTMKATRLAERFGERGFDYCGNESCDIAVWKRANGAIVVNGHRTLPEEVARHARVLHTFPRHRHAGMRGVLRALHIQGWLEEWLAFVPLLVTRRLDDTGAVVAALLAFLVLCLCSSSVRCAGDLMNIDADRRDARSGNPFSAGESSIFSGLLLVAALSCGAIAASLLLPGSFWLVPIVYALIAAPREIVRSRSLNVDVLSAAWLNAIRVLAGVVAISTTLFL